ncbi:hypothetical protein PV10_05680 [Exophiala mesophila]|uniref:DASH complex subunit DAD1 n=1 Tax=Exophiala mesophila TaxID=212818 RepID=A0A0D1XSI9_EXOME|nr:uncharacterized protein PV10_05680 [Exophiala mesophila]KIV91101.1 hypothetical protein PV10_05680 [Exophiala mesophila]
MATDASQQQPREFELRRAEIVGQIGESLEQVLAQINALNRSLEGIIEIGNEFASVEALWSQFETVMGREGNAATSASSNNTGYDGALGDASAHGNHR